MTKQNWEIALDKFIEPWKKKKEVVGAVACGSFITGNPSKHSDVDVQILLDKNVKWRERGDKIIDGVLIDYFTNPLPQNFKYFEEDYKDRSKMNVHMFLTGKVLFNKNGDVKIMIQKAKEWGKKKFKKMDSVKTELKKYHLWDMKDNLEEIYESGSNDFYFVYYNCLNSLLNTYLEFLGYDNMPIHKVKRFLTSEKDKLKYNLKDFPDKEFSDKFVLALNLKDKNQMIQDYKSITNYVLHKMGGFNIDGWKIRSKVEK